MKTIRIFLLLSAAMLLGCSDDKTESPVLSLDKETDPISFSVAATESYQYQVTTNQRSWKAEPDQEWCIVTRGADGKSFTVTANPNPYAVIREAEITVSAGRAEKLTIAVSQAAAQASVFSDGTTAAAFEDGSGTVKDPWIIADASQLKKLVDADMSATEGVYYKLAVDIQVTAAHWKPIGSVESFLGHFDGAGHTVRGTLTSSDYDYFGFFSSVRGSGSVNNFNIDGRVENNTAAENPFLNITGGITADLGVEASVKGCTVRGIVKGGWTRSPSYNRSYTGGIVGHAHGGVSGCTNYASVTGGSANSAENYAECYTGGIVGYSEKFIFECRNEGSVTGGSGKGGTDTRVCTGGVVGCGTGTIHRCHNGGIITKGTSEGNLPDIYTGGIAGLGNEVYSCCTHGGKIDGADPSYENVLGYGTLKTCGDASHFEH